MTFKEKIEAITLVTSGFEYEQLLKAVRELVKEAKPKTLGPWDVPYDESGTKYGQIRFSKGHNEALDEYEEALLKQLE